MQPSAFVRTSMVLWIGVDDTDSLRGMCTTFLATKLVQALTEEYDLIGYPRLVRLNPNIPWKTRGNGAVCLRIARGRGTARTVGFIRGRTIVSFPRQQSEANPADVEDSVAGVVEKWACFEDNTTNPGFAILSRQPGPGLYWRAVRGIVSKRHALGCARGLGIVKEYKNGRGVIGALASIAWRPRDRTYEILAYRDPLRWGHPRVVDPQSVVEMDRGFRTTFNNYDYDSDRMVIAPRSPCPVLFGIRGDDPRELPRAMSAITGEVAERALIFETNQGTDDHVLRTTDLNPFTTVRRAGMVSQRVRSLPGGHVVFSLDGHDVTAYEPSKRFRNIVRALVPGDRVEVIAAVRTTPRTLNLEKLHVVSLASDVRRLSNPLCPACGKHAKSLGRNAPFRCVRCGGRIPRDLVRLAPVPRQVVPGWYEPPPGSRRHLSKPLKRMGLPTLGVSLQTRGAPLSSEAGMAVRS